MSNVASSSGLVARFDGEGAVGRPVRLIETVPDSHRGAVRAAVHSVDMVEYFDDRLGKMVPLRVPRLFMGDGGPLAGLPSMPVWFHGLHYDFRGGGRKGTAFTVTPSEPGVYEVVARWSDGDAGGWLVSPPAVLTVRPAPAKP